MLIKIGIFVGGLIVGVILCGVVISSKDTELKQAKAETKLYRDQYEDIREAYQALSKSYDNLKDGYLDMCGRIHGIEK